MYEVPVQFTASIKTVGFSWSKDLAGYVYTHPDNAIFIGVDYVTPATYQVPGFVRNKNGDIFRWEASSAIKYQRCVGGLKRSRSSQLYEAGVKKPKKYGISNLCKGGNLCLK